MSNERFLRRFMTLAGWEVNVPSERDCCDLPVVSHSTVRQALHALETDGATYWNDGRAGMVDAESSTVRELFISHQFFLFFDLSFYFGLSPV